MEPGLVGDFLERAVAAVVEEVVGLAVGVLDGVEHVGDHVDIEPAVAVVVAEGADDAALDQGEAAGGGLLLEGAVALVDEEPVRGAETTDVEIEAAVVVHVGEGRALLPVLRRIGERVVAAADESLHPAAGGAAGQAGAIGDVLELPVAEIAEEAAAAGLADGEDIGPAIAIVVADGDAAARRTVDELLVAARPHAGIVELVVGDDARGFRREIGEERRPARSGARRERGGLERGGRRGGG